MGFRVAARVSEPSCAPRTLVRGVAGRDDVALQQPLEHVLAHAPLQHADHRRRLEQGRVRNRTGVDTRTRRRAGGGRDGCEVPAAAQRLLQCARAWRCCGSGGQRAGARGARAGRQPAWRASMLCSRSASTAEHDNNASSFDALRAQPAPALVLAGLLRARARPTGRGGARRCAWRLRARAPARRGAPPRVRDRARLPAPQRRAGAQLPGGVQGAPGVARPAHVQRRRRAVVRQPHRLALLGAPAARPGAPAA